MSKILIGSRACLSRQEVPYNKALHRTKIALRSIYSCELRRYTDRLSMMSASHIKDRRGSWLFVAPVSGVVVEPAINREIRINKVSFVDVNRLTYVRKRLGFPHTLRDMEKWTRNLGFFKKAQTYAVCTLGGRGSEKEPEFLRIAREELSLLSLSQLGFGRRRNYARLCLANERPVGTLRYFMTQTTGAGWAMSNSVSGRHMELHLGDQWFWFQRQTYFFQLLKVIRGNIDVSDGWRRDIKNAAILSGRSQSSAELDQAFLWNMIAIETLLTHKDDSYSKELPKRVEAFLGWSVNWPERDYEARIKEIYGKRCTLVHAGQTDDLSVDDLLFTDNLLLNVFHNVLRHLDLFRSKQDLIEFSKKVEAEHILGQSSRVRPRTLSFINIQYSDKDYTAV